MIQFNTTHLLISIVAVTAIIVSGYLINAHLKRQALQADKLQELEMTQRGLKDIQDRQVAQEQLALQKSLSPQQYCYHQAIKKWAKDNDKSVDDAPLEVTSKALKECGLLSKS